MMTIDEMQAKLADDKFSYELRMNLHYDKLAFDKLISTLKQLSLLLKNESAIPKALAQDLYVTTNVIRNSLDWLKVHKPDSQLTDNVENAWIDIDNLIIECLSDTVEISHAK